MQALISLCDGEEDYFEGFFDIQDSSEESALDLVREVGKYDWRKLHCVRVRADHVEHHFDRDELREIAAAQPNEIDLCEHCEGNRNPYCNAHGVAASNARQDAYWRSVGGHD